MGVSIILVKRCADGAADDEFRGGLLRLGGLVEKWVGRYGWSLKRVYDDNLCL